MRQKKNFKLHICILYQASAQAYNLPSVSHCQDSLGQGNEGLALGDKTIWGMHMRGRRKLELLSGSQNAEY